MNTDTLTPEVYQADRVLHHELSLQAYYRSFDRRNLTKRYRDGEFRRLRDVFQKVQIGDPLYPTIQRPVDTFDLINPRLGAKIRDAIHRDLPSQARASECLKTVDRYCRFLKDEHTIYIPGQVPLYIPELYGPIESPLNRYAIPRKSTEKPPNKNYLTANEYRLWLKFTFGRVQSHLNREKCLKYAQIHLACVLTGEIGLRLQEIIGLEPQHFALADNTCLVVRGKGNKGSGYRKRQVDVSAFAKTTLQDFLKCFPRDKIAPLFQNAKGERLSIHTAHHWMDELIGQIKQAGLPIFLDKGFGWHAFRRTFATRHLREKMDIFSLKKNGGWSWISTIATYACDGKAPTSKGLPLL